MSDFQLLLTSLRNAYNQKLPFVAYRKPSDSLVNGLIQSNHKIHYSDNFQSSGFIFAPFDYTNNAIIIPRESSKLLSAPFPLEEAQNSVKFRAEASATEKATYIDLVNRTLQFIDEGKAVKIVTSRKEEIQMPNFSFASVFERLLQTYKNAFVYVWYHPTIGLWLGATPEGLLSVKGKLFKTVSLAGTQAYQNMNDIDWGDKEINEQQIVTNYITSKLNSVAASISVSGPSTVQAGNIVHLKTKIEGVLKETSSVRDLVHLLHPTAAICGVPEGTAKQFIVINESYDREYYTGFLGEINSNNDLNLFVNLRCMKVEGFKIALFLGGGITRDSNSLDEWEETVSKSKIIKNIL